MDAVPGIVTAVRAQGPVRGFWMQDEDPDADLATSEGIFVFTSSSAAPTVVTGTRVTVTGAVSEHRPGVSE